MRSPTPLPLAHVAPAMGVSMLAADVQPWPGSGALMVMLVAAAGGLGLLTVAGRWWRYRRARRRFRGALLAEGAWPRALAMRRRRRW